MKTIVTILITLTISFLGFAQQEFSKKKLSDSIELLLNEKNIPGAFVTVVTKDTVLFESGFGYATIPSKTKTTTEHLFKIGSISKTFTALAIMKLAAEGDLSLEDHLKDIAPEIPFKNKWETTHPVKVKHLLEHKAGFDDLPISVIAAQRTNNITALDEVLKNKGALKSRWQPGLGHSYSNPGYTILGYLIEKTTGQRYQDYIHANILVPLQMKQTHFRSMFGDPLPEQQFATGYRKYSDTLTESRDTKIVGEAAGSLLSNANDMGRFLQFMLNTQVQDSLPIVSATDIKKMETLHGDLEIQNNIILGYGLGLYTRTFGTDDVLFIGHSGGINGFSSDFIYSKELDLAFAISNNSENGNRALLDLLVDTFVNNNPTSNSEAAITVEQFSEWEGTYRKLTTRNQIFDFVQFPLETVSVVIENDSLYLEYFLQDKNALVSHGGIAFGEKNEVNPSLYLAENGEEKYLHLNNDILVPVNGNLFLFFRILLSFSLLLGVIGVVVLLGNAVVAFFKKKWRSALKRNTIVVLPALALFISMILMFSNMTLEKLETLGQLNLLTVSIFLFTTLLPVASLWAAFWLYKNKRTKTKRFFKVYYHLIVFGAIFLSVYCMYHGWFMKMMWA